MENRQVPSPNAYDFYLAACESLADDALPGHCAGGCACDSCGEEPCEPTLEEKTAILKRNSAALQKLREGFEHEFLVPPGVMHSISDSTTKFGCKRLAELLTIESDLLSAAGDHEGAVSSLLDIVRMGADLPRGGLVIDALVGRAVEAVGLARAWDLVERLDSLGAKGLAHRAESICLRSWPIAETLEDEKRWGYTYLTEQCRYRGWKLPLSSVCTQDEGWLSPFRALLRMLFLSRGAILADYERFMDAQIALARMPYSVADEQPEVTGNYVSLCLGVDVRSAARVQVEVGHTQKAFLATALALHAYRLDHGTYPGGLSGLVPGYLGAVPQDPFAEDAPLRYRIEGDRYILYSIGPDGIDGGGTPIFSPDATFAPRSQYRVHANSNGDIVAGVNH